MRKIPAAVWTPLATALLVFIPGVLAWAAGQAWLFPSLGPTAIMQADRPEDESSRLYNVLLGHALGIVAALLCVWAFSATLEPSVISAKVVQWRRLLTSTLSLALMAIGQFATRSKYPPAAATALLITLGAFEPTWGSLETLAIGIVILAVAGDVLRLARTRL